MISEKSCSMRPLLSPSPGILFLLLSLSLSFKSFLCSSFSLCLLFSGSFSISVSLSPSLCESERHRILITLHLSQWIRRRETRSLSSLHSGTSTCSRTRLSLNSTGFINEEMVREHLPAPGPGVHVSQRVSRAKGFQLVVVLLC